MARSSGQKRRWTRLEYERLVDAGFFRGEPIELIGGELLVAEPQGNPHAISVTVTEEALRTAFGVGWVVFEEKPIAPDEDSEPEPDVCVAPGVARDYLGGHPARPVLVVEVADSSLAWDREDKGSLYARAGITDYWIVNLIDRVLEVYRRPVSDLSASFGWRYESVGTFRPPASVSPLARPAARVAVADLLP